jgi:hypothetical protein
MGINFFVRTKMSCKKSKVLVYLIFGVCTLISLNSHAWGTTHYHGGGWGYGRGYGPGAYPGWWGGPNVIINVPIIPVVPAAPYVRECETVEICNQYDECWLERQCN